ncbi:MAG: F0F1 ATP synthase subunit epsilon [Actinomycetota bacterium]|nr:F0F1 ATP synthase subunit epsilon [Actinomycetota bacterium]
MLMPLYVQLVSPEEELFAGEADFVAARTVEGEIGILPGHIPLLGQLKAPSNVKIKSPADERNFEVQGGFITVKDDKVIILAEETEEPA